MCVAVPVKIVEICNESTAIIDANGVKREVNVAFIDSPEIGDYVLVHAGFAIKKWTAEEAKEFFELMKEINLNQ
jgi:hydrogenase expression/formation protein HypC